MEGNLNDLKHSDLQYNSWRQAQKDITFAGATPNAIGDFDGTGEPHDIFTVTGTVTARIIALCTTTLTIAATATLKVGTAITPGGLIALEAGDAIDVHEIWHDTTCDTSVELGTVAPEFIVNQNIIGTTETANINTGVIRYICLWKPVSRDGKLVAA